MPVGAAPCQSHLHRPTLTSRTLLKSEAAEAADKRLHQSATKYCDFPRDEQRHLTLDRRADWKSTCVLKCFYNGDFSHE